MLASQNETGEAGRHRGATPTAARAVSHLFLQNQSSRVGPVNEPVTAAPWDSAQYLRAIPHSTPVTYFMEACRMIILKGSGWRDVRDHQPVSARAVNVNFSCGH